MSWVTEEARERSPHSGIRAESTAEQIFDQATARRWQELVNELRQDVDDFNSEGGSASFTQPSGAWASIACATTGITLHINADLAGRAVRYDYVSDGRAVAAPEGGILSLRLSRYRRAEIYSADEHLTSEEARRLLLEPVFFPPGEQTIAA
jgi:hypothetical protein